MAEQGFGGKPASAFLNGRKVGSQNSAAVARILTAVFCYPSRCYSASSALFIRVADPGNGPANFLCPAKEGGSDSEEGGKSSGDGSQNPGDGSRVLTAHFSMIDARMSGSPNRVREFKMEPMKDGFTRLVRSLYWMGNKCIIQRPP